MGQIIEDDCCGKPNDCTHPQAKHCRWPAEETSTFGGAWRPLTASEGGTAHPFSDSFGQERGEEISFVEPEDALLTGGAVLPNPADPSLPDS